MLENDNLIRRSEQYVILELDAVSRGTFSDKVVVIRSLQVFVILNRTEQCLDQIFVDVTNFGR